MKYWKLWPTRGKEEKQTWEVVRNKSHGKSGTLNMGMGKVKIVQTKMRLLIHEACMWNEGREGSDNGCVVWFISNV